MKEKLVTYERGMQFAFKIMYLMLVIATFNSFLFMTVVQSVLVKACLLLAIGTILLRLLDIKKFIKTAYWPYLALFCLSYLISSVFNAKYGITENLKWLIWMGLVFSLLYLTDAESSTTYYKKEVKILSHIMLIYSLVAAISSLYMMVSRYAVLKQYGDVAVKAGYFWGRLWGVYTDPNYGATFNVAMIILALYFCKVTSKKRLKVFYIVTMVFDFLYVIYSDSRTAQVSMLVGAGFWVFCLVWNYLREKSTVKRIGSGLLTTIVIAILVFFVMSGLKSLYINQIAPYMETHSSRVETEIEEVTKIEYAQERENDKETDISNRRFDLWKSGIEVWRTSPIFGTGYTTFDAYALENVPDTYAVNNDYGVFGNTHNEYVNILVFQGLVGILILVFFMKNVICDIWGYLWKCEEEDFLYIATLVAVIAMVSASMVFLLEGLYTNSFGVFMLWYFLGVVMQFINKKQKKRVRGKRKNG